MGTPRAASPASSARCAPAGSAAPVQASAERSSRHSTCTSSSVQARTGADRRPPSSGVSLRSITRRTAQRKSSGRACREATASRSRSSSPACPGDRWSSAGSARSRRASRAAGSRIPTAEASARIPAAMDGSRSRARSCRSRTPGSPSRSRAQATPRAPSGSRARSTSPGGKVARITTARSMCSGPGRPTVAAAASTEAGRASPPAPERAGPAGRGSAGGDPGSPWVILRIRSSRGGWVAIRLPRKPPTPSAKKRCEASSASGEESREPCFSIFPSARARPPGFRVNCTAAASARNSRCRDTASRMSRPKKAPIDPATRSESPAPRITPPRPLPRPSPPRSRIRPSSASTVRPPTIAMSRVLSRVSALRTWESSWATTPCSSSRSRPSSAPRVTATTERSGVKPAAKAFIPGSPSRT